jgi:hypothetical protein
MAAVGKFSCKDKEVEDFLRNKAFDFDARHKSRTYLVVDDEKAEQELVVLGFFSLTMKTLELGSTLSKNVIKRIDGFSKEVMATEAVLIGQLGKNQNCQSVIDGQTILEFALDVVYMIHELAGGRIVFLECEDKPRLVDFYTSNGFIALQKSDKYLQMIRYL